jgi:hypothetical protein
VHPDSGKPVMSFHQSRSLFFPYPLSAIRDPL